MDRVALDLGFFQIYWYSIFIFLGLAAASFVVFKEGRKRNVNEDFLVNLIFNSIIIGIIGARVYYVLFNLQYYLSNPIEIFAIWNGGLAIHGGVIAATIFIIFYCKKNKIHTLQILDILVVGLIIGQAIGRWGNFFNSEAYGHVTTLEALQKQGIPKFIINGMFILGEYHQPTFFYESIWCFGGFIALLIIRKYKYLKRGQLTGFYLVWYGIERFLVEALRMDSLMIGSIKIAQLVSIIYIIGGLILFFYNIRKKDEQLLYRDDFYEKKEEELIRYYKKRGDHYV